MWVTHNDKLNRAAKFHGALASVSIIRSDNVCHRDTDCPQIITLPWLLSYDSTRTSPLSNHQFKFRPSPWRLDRALCSATPCHPTVKLLSVIINFVSHSWFEDSISFRSYGIFLKKKISLQKTIFYLHEDLLYEGWNRLWNLIEIAT